MWKAQRLMLTSDSRAEEVIRLLGPSEIGHHSQRGEHARDFLLHSNMFLLDF
jgi:hypothetical protein